MPQQFHIKGKIISKEKIVPGIVIGNMADWDGEWRQWFLVDISKSFERLFCRNIVHICLGKDLSETLIELDVADESGSKFER